MVTIGAYDVDTNDNLTLLIQPPTYGEITLRDEVRSIPQRQNCSQLLRSSEGNVLPCGLETPHEVVRMLVV